jgi:uncharacterized protein (TIGR00251 family)
VHNALSLKETKDGVLLSVFVKPNSPKFKIELDGGEVVVYATEEPERGKVNKEIIKELSRLLHVQVELVTGFTSRQKQILVKGLSKQQIEQLLVSK